MKKKIALLTAVSILTAYAVRIAIVWRRMKNEEGEQNNFAFD